MKLRTEWPAIVAFAVAFAVAAYAWPRTPELMPVHWGPDGQPDRYGGRFEALLLVPLIMLAAAALLGVVQRYAPDGAGNAPVLRTARFGLGLLAAVLSLQVVFGWPVPRTALIAVGVQLVLLGNIITKARPSAFVGIRTPWTFASRRAWFASQRRGGFWLTGFGLALALLGAFTPDAWLFPWVAPFGLIGGLLLMLAWLTYASYRDWRRDPNPESALRHD